ncbi:IS30 family transposase [Rhodococcoides fascians]|uniref:IS30 family transposase n=1 Tax=Rhodococcoides fascians TaxID=1828 RepID=UPI00379F3215
MSRRVIPNRAEVVARFHAMRDSGASVIVASAAAGVSRSTGMRWTDQRKGIVRGAKRIRSEPSGRFLSQSEREEIAIGRAMGLSQTDIADLIGRDKSVVSRELGRNTNLGGTYRSVSAQQRAETRARRPKAAKLADPGSELRAEVVRRLGKKWSPQQISATLKIDFPDRPEMHVSHETIYNAIYVQAKGELKADVADGLRAGRAHRRKHGRVPSNAHHIPDKTLISERPDDVEDRKVPGHWEGDLILGAGNKSAIGTLVERTSRFTMLLHLPHSHNLDAVRDAMIAAIRSMPDTLKQSVTWDQGMEMRRHAEITMATDMAIYFCDPHSPWQRGTNENTNGLLRQYFKKGTDLSAHTAERLQAVAAELNDRPRRTLGWNSPAKVINELVVATTA